MRGRTVSPSGSAFLNLLVKGCRSRLGRDWTKRKVCSCQSARSLHSRSCAGPYVLATDSLDNVVRRRSQQLGDDGELIDVVLAWKQWFALQHLCEYTSCTPDVHFHVIFLPCEHDLRRPVVPRRYITSHLWVLYTGKTEVADLQVAVFVYKDVARLQVAVDDPGRVNVFKTSLIPLAQRNGS